MTAKQLTKYKLKNLVPIGDARNHRKLAEKSRIRIRLQHREAGLPFTRFLVARLITKSFVWAA